MNTYTVEYTIEKDGLPIRKSVTLSALTADIAIQTIVHNESQAASQFMITDGLTYDDKVVYVYSDERGVYIPASFISDFSGVIQGISDWCREQLKSLEPYGDDSDFYWMAWDEVLRNGYIMHNGIKYTVHQDGDVWFIANDQLTDEESARFFGE